VVKVFVHHGRARRRPPRRARASFAWCDPPEFEAASIKSCSFGDICALLLGSNSSPPPSGIVRSRKESTAPYPEADACGKVLRGDRRFRALTNLVSVRLFFFSSPAGSLSTCGQVLPPLRPGAPSPRTRRPPKRPASFVWSEIPGAKAGSEAGRARKEKPRDKVAFRRGAGQAILPTGKTADSMPRAGQTPGRTFAQTSFVLRYAGFVCRVFFANGARSTPSGRGFDFQGRARGRLGRPASGVNRSAR